MYRKAILEENVKKIGNGQELIQTNRTSYSQNQRERSIHTKIDNGHERDTQLTASAAFSQQVVIQVP